MSIYMPEGQLINRLSNRGAMLSQSTLNEAYLGGSVLEARVILCDSAHNLHVDLGCMRGIIPREEGALGIDEGSVRDIALISRVNKPVMFRVAGFEIDDKGRTRAVLSRKSVQRDCVRDYIRRLTPGDVIPARVSHLESFGVFADVGAGISALLPIDSISVSRIPHPNVRMTAGQEIRAVVRGVDELDRVTLSHKELLGTWEQNAADFEAGQTVPGIVRSVEEYGVFVELAPNLAGLAESVPGIAPGQSASVYIKSILPERMKIKLIVVDSFSETLPPPPVRYFTDCDHIDRWVYSPDCCGKIIESVF
ncbi:MAG: S1 RNA-binding domain-containing protein [Oscillospiraceae bacterium]|nr:S1 RNA-binding domain-containing protein [Oscillospiraceae bacterium]